MLLSFVEKATERIDESTEVNFVHMDFSMAYDIPHGRLAQVVRSHGI